MTRYRVKVPITSLAVFEVVSDTPQGAREKVAFHLQMGLDERLGFVRLEDERIAGTHNEWQTEEVQDE